MSQTRSNVPDNLCPVVTDLSTMMPGDWRAMRPIVDRDKCVKCAICWMFCPVQCIKEMPAWFDVNYATCKGCGICANECPHRAIVMIEEPQE
ncbi:MAG: 4Fe-4S binding protein [Rhodospirillales bacterium]|nr:4Fe-4S binding protein [Rhodospirillales bacterium]